MGLFSVLVIIFLYWGVLSCKEFLCCLTGTKSNTLAIGTIFSDVTLYFFLYLVTTR